MPVNKNKKSPRYGKTYKVGKGGSHVYTIGGKRVVIGGKKKSKTPKDPYAPQVESALSLKFGPAEREIASERRISDQALSNSDRAWAEYQRSLEVARQRVQGGYQAAQQGVYGQANVARQQDQAQAGELDKAAQAQAAQRGATAGASPAAAAQAARQASMTNFGSLLGTQGSAQNAYMASQYATAGGIRAAEGAKERARRRLVDQKAQDLAKEKGAARVSVRQELSDQAWKTQLEEATFGLRRQDTLQDNARQEAALRTQQRRDRQSAKDRAAQRRLTRRQQNLSHQDRVESQRIQREKAARGGSGAKGKTRYHKGYGNTNVSLAKAVTARQQWSGILDHPTNTDKPPRGNPTLVRAAAEYHRNNGKVSKKTALRIYRTFGFRVPYGKPKKKAPRRNPKKPTSVISPW